MLEKSGEGLRDNASIPFALAGIDSFRAALTSFRASLDGRGIGGAHEDSVGDVLSSLDVVLEALVSSP